ncbi:MAG: TetR/AcrR family transcriptional regulator, partial [Candidatus Nanohaloarchaea archaeon]
MGETSEEIMEAAFRALSEHGYAELSIQRIADESGRTKSAIYYHYDDKEELLEELLEHIRQQIEKGQPSLDGLEPREKLDRQLEL